MLQRKPLVWFLVIAFAISWPLFLVPLLLTNLDPLTRQLVTQGLWALAMWGPGIAAILATLVIAKESFRTLRLNTLGPKRYYLWAWFLPPILAIVGGIFALLFGVAEFDTEFTLMRESLAQASNSTNFSPGLLVAIQILFALTVASFINVLFALGEELGWRGFLLPRLLPLGQWNAILLSGAIWGLWHAPAIAQGLNYPGYPVIGTFMMIVFCILLGTIISWLTLNTQSPWVAALAHGSINASAGLAILFFKPGIDIALGGTIASLTGWISMILFIGWLALTQRLPVSL